VVDDQGARRALVAHIELEHLGVAGQVATGHDGTVAENALDVRRLRPRMGPQFPFDRSVSDGVTPCACR
jgi:hypothetical protein